MLARGATLRFDRTLSAILPFATFPL